MNKLRLSDEQKSLGRFLCFKTYRGITRQVKQCLSHNFWFQKKEQKDLRQFIIILPFGFENLTMALRGSLKIQKSLPFGFLGEERLEK